MQGMKDLNRDGSFEFFSFVFNKKKIRFLCDVCMHFHTILTFLHRFSLIFRDKYLHSSMDQLGQRPCRTNQQLVSESQNIGRMFHNGHRRGGEGWSVLYDRRKN